MTPKEFEKYLARDLFRCYHCGKGGEQLIPQHRLGRGMGGKNSKANQPSNIITFCSAANGLLEADADFAQAGRDKGWKLSSSQEPALTPVFESWSGLWWLLDNSGSRALVPLI